MSVCDDTFSNFEERIIRIDRFRIGDIQRHPRLPDHFGALQSGSSVFMRFPRERI